MQSGTQSSRRLTGCLFFESRTRNQRFPQPHCTTSTTLRMHEPDLCNQLLARGRKCIDERRLDLGESAEAALKKTPVPSLRTVCKRMGITAWFMNQYRKCGVEVHSSGLYPSAAKIADRIPRELAASG